MYAQASSLDCSAFVASCCQVSLEHLWVLYSLFFVLILWRKPFISWQRCLAL